MQTQKNGLYPVDLTHNDQVSAMTLKALQRILLTFLMFTVAVTTTAGLANAQLPFGNLTPPEEGGEGTPAASDPGGLQDDRPMRPIARPPVGSGIGPERPSDDEFGDEIAEQLIEVTERFAGWQGAGNIDGARLSNTLRCNWVMLDRNGQFTGTVRGIDDAEVAGMTIFLMNNGRLVKTAAVQEDGSFVFTNVQRGAYSLVGWGDKAFFAFGANIINDNPDADPSTPTSINCYAFQNETTINTDWIRYFAPNISYRVFGRYSVEEGPEDPDQLYGFEGLNQNAVSASLSTSIGGTPVSLDSRGRLVGRVHQMNSINGRPVDLRSTKVMILKGDNVVDSTTTDNFGIFRFAGIRPGEYGLVAVGVDGVGSVGIQVAGSDAAVIDAEGVAQDGGDALPFDFTMVSAETVGWLNHYASEVAYRQAVLKPRMQMPTTQQYADPVCPTCLGIMGPGGCPKCGTGRQNPICNSPCVTYGQWVANGCACQKQRPAWQRIGERVRDEVERIDDRFEEVFYGEGNTATNLNQNLNNGGYGGQGGGYVPPIVQPNAAPAVPPIVQPGNAPIMPMAQGTRTGVQR